MRFSLLLVSAFSSCYAFAPLGGTTSQLKPLSLFPPEHHQTVVDFIQLHHQTTSSSSFLLSDAAAATADAAQAGDGGGGWWAQYLSIFKATLTAVHSTIDGPLRSIGFEQTWGVSIFLFTAGMRSLLLPLSIQQTKSAELMKSLKPYMSEIKEKIKNKDAQNRAIGQLYEDAEQNPLSGCLLSIAQLPVLLGLYRGIRNLAQDGVLKEGFFFIPSLEGPVSPPDYRGMQWLTEGWTAGVDGGLPVPQMGWETTLAFLIMPVVLVLGQSLSMSVLTPELDENMGEEEREQAEKSQVFLKFLPLMIGYFSLQVPAGLTIYWFTSNLFTLAQSLTIKAYYAANPPEINLPDYWDSLDDMEAMSADEKRAAAQAGLNMGPSLDSLVEEANFHYMVERKPLREASPAWSRVVASGKMNVPAEMDEWVKGEGAHAVATASKVEEQETPFFASQESS